MNELVTALFSLSAEGKLVLSFVMLPLSFWVALIAMRSNQDLKIEQQLLKRIQPLARIPDEDTVLEPADIDKFHEAFKSAPTSSLVRRVTLAILGARVINAPDLEAIMGLLLSREAGRLGAVRNAPNLLMLAGLLGTVFGLAGSVGGLSAQIATSLDQGNTDALSRGSPREWIAMLVLSGRSIASIWARMESVHVRYQWRYPKKVDLMMDPVFRNSSTKKFLIKIVNSNQRVA